RAGGGGSGPAGAGGGGRGGPRGARAPPPPTLSVRDHTAYVSEPGKRQLHSFELDSGKNSGKKGTSVPLPKATSELSGTVDGH
ncbi:hypothetical protein ACFXOP_24820, partial [Streptomyces sp. NPDC059144]